ncbi:MAG: lytic transglycosylase [Desulfuromonas sp.]|nr:MAG: lytic transglycosylase [Desulfuromonas sp.]
MLRFFFFCVLVLLCSACLPRADVARDAARSSAPAATAPLAAAISEVVREEGTKPEEGHPLLVGTLVESASKPLPEIVESYLQPVAVPLPYAGDFPLTQHRRVEKLLSYYTGNGRRSFSLWLRRAASHIPRIQLIFAREGVPLDLAYLAMIESGFNERAYSWAHAVGPWQFIESTGAMYGLRNDWWCDERRDIEKATFAAARFLKDLNRRFDGDWYLAAAAYNAGGGKINKAIRERGSRDFWALTEGRVLQEETKNYLPKLIAALMIVRDLDAYGFADLDYHGPQDYEMITLASTTDLDLIARLGDIDYDQLKRLNPELKRWCTPPGVTDYQLRVPVGSAEKIEQGYAQLPVEQRARYHRHQIARGDTLRALAKRYRIQVDDIIALNDIRNPRALQIGDDLILPLQEGFSSLPIDEMADDYARSRRTSYTVRKGDSLWTISQRFDVSEKQLRVWNRLGWSNLLRPGQVLAVSAPRRKSLGGSGPVRKLVYQVQRGDTLWGIGRQFDVELDQIRDWNGLGRSHMLQPGQKLTLLVTGSQRG